MVVLWEEQYKMWIEINCIRTIKREREVKEERCHNCMWGLMPPSQQRETGDEQKEEDITITKEFSEEKNSQHKESWALKNWCFWTVVLGKTLENPLDCKEIQPVHPKGNQSWIFIWRTDAEALILLPPDVNSWLIGKDPDVGKDWRQKKRAAEDGMVGWHH